MTINSPVTVEIRRIGAVQRELGNLSRVGLIVRSSLGSQVFYQANREAPIFREMQALVNKTIGVFSVLRSALHPLAKRVLVAFVYGSVARDEQTAQSDVDLMVIGKATLDEVLSRGHGGADLHRKSVVDRKRIVGHIRL
jgi:predicted nucleotidyltransferase